MLVCTLHAFRTALFTYRFAVPVFAALHEFQPGVVRRLSTRSPLSFPSLNREHMLLFPRFLLVDGDNFVHIAVHNCLPCVSGISSLARNDHFLPRGVHHASTETCHLAAACTQSASAGFRIIAAFSHAMHIFHGTYCYFSYLHTRTTAFTEACASLACASSMRLMPDLKKRFFSIRRFVLAKNLGIDYRNWENGMACMLWNADSQKPRHTGLSCAE